MGLGAFRLSTIKINFFTRSEGGVRSYLTWLWTSIPHYRNNRWEDSNGFLLMGGA